MMHYEAPCMFCGKTSDCYCGDDYGRSFIDAYEKLMATAKNATVSYHRQWMWNGELELLGDKAQEVLATAILRSGQRERDSSFIVYRMPIPAGTKQIVFMGLSKPINADIVVITEKVDGDA